MRHPLQVLVHRERAAAVDADDLEDAVAAQQPLVRDRDVRFGGVGDDTVDACDQGAHEKVPPLGIEPRTFGLRVPLLCQLSYRGAAGKDRESGAASRRTGVGAAGLDGLLDRLGLLRVDLLLDTLR